MAAIIDSMERSNDSTQARLDDARSQLDTSLQSMAEVATLLDKLAGQKYQIKGKGESGALDSVLTAAELKARSVERIEQLRRRLDGLNASLGSLRDSNSKSAREILRLTGLVASLTRTIETQEERLAELSNTIVRVTAERDSVIARSGQLQTDLETRTAALETRTAIDDSVFVLIGDAERLLALGVLEQAGGVFNRIGRTMRLRAQYPRDAFSFRSKRATQAVYLPRADRTYHILTAQDVSCASLPEDSIGGPGRSLSIRDAECFWKPGRYLVIEERR